MCGIAGKLSWTTRPDPDTVRRITNEMERRGPDAFGFHFTDVIGLGHRRLSIIDLSDSGRQPMVDRSGKYWIVFNGEIYNFLELKKHLLATGVEFNSNSDTEIILEAYKLWGEEALGRLNGMFAFALWDEDRQKLFLARDRLGKKPLYYYLLPDGGIVFASELKALLRDPEISARLNLQALGQYLSLSYVLSDCSIIEGVKKLEAAHAMLIERGKDARIWQYWHLKDFFNKKTELSISDAEGELRGLLEDSCRLRLISDVPLGAFLSGGLDSSSVVSAMCRLRDPKTVQTFSIGFKEKSYSELDEARTVARYLDVHHEDQTVDAEMAGVLRDIVRAADEPFADNSSIPMWYLSQFTRKHVTVALSGDGGDEIFAGYETYAADRLHRLSQFCPEIALSGLSRLVHSRLPVTFDKVSLDFKLRRFFSGMHLSGEEAHYSWRQIFSESQKAQLLGGAISPTVLAQNPFARFQSFYSELPGAHYLDQAMYVDIKTWLVDDILVKADRMSMAHSLELRCPFLDHRLVEFAASLPVAWKIKGFEKKYLLKRSQRKYLPKRIIYRKKKGFNAPVAHWLNAKMGAELLSVIKRQSALQDLFQLRYVEQLLERHREQKEDNSLQLFNLLVFALWSEQLL